MAPRDWVLNLQDLTLSSGQLSVRSELHCRTPSWGQGIGQCGENPDIWCLEVVLWSMCKNLLSRVRLFATPWTVGRQAPLSMEFSGPEYWSG